MTDERAIFLDALRRGAIIASIYLGLTVTLVVTNLLLSLRGSADKVGGNVPLRFVWFGVVFQAVGKEGGRRFMGIDGKSG